MNPVHIHLVLNHVPIVGLFFGIVITCYGIYSRSDEIKRLGQVFFILLAILTIPVFLTGEGAEEAVEHLPGVSETLIEEHEEAALLGLISVIALGAVSLSGFILKRGSRVVPDWAVKASLLISLLSLLLLGWAANLGGVIRHTEIRSGGGQASMPEVFLYGAHAHNEESEEHEHKHEHR